MGQHSFYADLCETAAKDRKRQSYKYKFTDKNNMKTLTFSTDSFILATYLLTEGLEIIGQNTTDPTRIVFVFEESSKRKELTGKFLSYKTLVEPHRFYSASKDIKQMIHQNKK